MAGEGQILRAAREEKGWTLLEAEEITKIRTRYLQALEEEDYAVLPGAAYIKGFLRTYAKQLGLDQEIPLGLYKASLSAVAQEPVLRAPLTPIKTRPFWLRPAIALLMSALAIALVIGISHFTQKPGETVRSEYSPAPLPEAPKEPQQANAPVPSAQPPASAGTSTGGTATNPDNSTALPTGDALKAKLVFTEDCWVNLRIDSQAPTQQYFSAGTTKEITATQKIEFLVVGNAGGVTITLNGKPYPSLGASGQVKHNIVLDKESLKAL